MHISRFTNLGDLSIYRERTAEDEVTFHLVEKRMVGSEKVEVHVDIVVNNQDAGKIYDTINRNKYTDLMSYIRVIAGNTKNPTIVGKILFKSAMDSLATQRSQFSKLEGYSYSHSEKPREPHKEEKTEELRQEVKTPVSDAEKTRTDELKTSQSDVEKTQADALKASQSDEEKTRANELKALSDEEKTRANELRTSQSDAEKTRAQEAKVSQSDAEKTQAQATKAKESSQADEEKTRKHKESI